jgi:hypothetical protein
MKAPDTDWKLSRHGTSQTAPSVPLAGEVTVGVRVIAGTPRMVRMHVRLALAELPSVVSVVASTEAGGAQLLLTTTSLAALLTEMSQAPALDGADISWTPEDGLTLRLALPAEAKSPVATASFVAQEAPVPIRPLAALPPDFWQPLPPRVSVEAAAVATTAPPPPFVSESLPVLVEPAGSPHGGAERSAGGLRRAFTRLRAWWSAGGSVMRVAIVPVMLVMAAVPRTMSAPSQASFTTVESLPPTPTHTESLRSFDSVCLMAPDGRPCDAATHARWRGDPVAWRDLASQSGEPAPAGDDVVERTIRLRLALGDPQTRIDVARRTGSPALFISAAVYIEEGEELDIEVEIANLGTAAADLGGARVMDGSGATLLLLPAGASLAAGERCRLATNPPVDSPCPFVPLSVRRTAGPGPVPLTLRGRAGEHLDTLVPAIAQR